VKSATRGVVMASAESNMISSLIDQSEVQKLSGTKKIETNVKSLTFVI
jgi:hypothetical protein